MPAPGHDWKERLWGSGTRYGIATMDVSDFTTFGSAAAPLVGERNWVGNFFFDTQSAVGKEIIFEFVNDVTTSGMLWVQDNSASQGTFDFDYWDEDLADWVPTTAAAVAITPNELATSTYSSWFSTKTISWDTVTTKKIRMTGVSGSMSNSPYIYGIAFYTDEPAVGTAGARSGGVVSMDTNISYGGGLGGLIDGYNNDSIYFFNQSATGLFLEFTFPAPIVCTGVHSLISAVGGLTQGVWNVEGWNGTSWDLLASAVPFTYSAVPGVGSTEASYNLWANETEHTKIKFTGVSGTLSLSPYMREFQFITGGGGGGGGPDPEPGFLTRQPIIFMS